MFGPPISAAMVLTTSEPNKTPPIPLADMPLIVIQDVGSNILKRLPEMPGGDDLSYSKYRQQQVFEEMAAIKQATQLHKAYDRRQRAVAKAKGRAAQRQAEGR